MENIRTYRAKLAEERLDLVVADLGGQAADKDLAVACLRLLRIDLLVVDDMLTGVGHLVDRFGRRIHDERESAAAARLRVGLHVDALDLAVLAKVLAQLLCGYAQNKKTQWSMSWPPIGCGTVVDTYSLWSPS